MVSFRPHIITYTTLAQKAYKDSNNNWVQGNAGMTITVPCMYQTNGDAKTITSTDGQNVIYKGVVFMDKGLDIIQPGTSIIVKEGTIIVIESKVIQSIPGHLKSHKLFV